MAREEPQASGINPESASTPAWAKDLRELYNAVVEEPLPDSFLAVLAQLDSKG